MADLYQQLSVEVHPAVPSVVLRTWTQNLLQTTLAIPFAQMSWPVPRGYVPRFALSFSSIASVLPHPLKFIYGMRRAERTTPGSATRTDIARAERTTSGGGKRVDE